MPALVAGIRVFRAVEKMWMAGTSPIGAKIRA
jgi:hypothetical protein